MTRKWWLLIKEKYPLALEDCINYFKRTHKDKWREVIQQREWLVDYFKSKKIGIETRNINSNGETRYGSKVWGERIQWWSSMILNSEEEAINDALYLAFWVREEALTYHQGTTRKKIP